MVHFVHALSPVHMGTGASTGGIDLPLAREPGTHWPVVPGSGLKGVLRSSELQLTSGRPDVAVRARMGHVRPRPGRADVLRPATAVPARALLQRRLAWVTSPAALAAYRGEARWGLPAAQLPPDVPAEPGVQSAVCTSPKSPLLADKAVFLHDLRFDAAAAAPLAAKAVMDWADHIGAHVFPGAEAQRERELFAARMLLVSEAAFAYLSKVAMDVRTRVRLVERKAVASSGPWLEESLPVETVLWGSVAADAVQKTDNVTRSAQQAIETFSPRGRRGAAAADRRQGHRRPRCGAARQGGLRGGPRWNRALYRRRWPAWRSRH
jgi:CRISPR-associated protein Cmr4